MSNAIRTSIVAAVIESGSSETLEILASMVPSRAQSLSLRALAAERRQKEEAAKA